MRHLVVITAAIMAALWPRLLPAGTVEEAADSFAVRPVFIDASRVPALLAEQKELVLLPRGRFEAALERARQRARAVRSPPRLMEAHYQANLMGDFLSGAAEWKVLNPHPEEAILPLSAWNLAVQTPISAGGRAALFGELADRKPGLLVPPGWQTFRFQWSARAAESGADGLAFNLEWPAVPVAAFELELPAGQEIDPLSGGEFLPLGLEATAKQRWRTACGGQTQLAFRVRPARNHDRPPIVVARQHAQHTLMPASMDSVFEFDLEARNAKLHELVLEGDGAFEPTHVQCRKSVTWREQAHETSKRLVIRLDEPLEGRTSVEIHGRFLLKKGERLVFPLLRLLNGHITRETLQLRLSRDVPRYDWRFGGFALTGADAADPEDFETLSLLRRDGPDHAEPPSVSVMRRPPSLLVRQDSWWRLAESGSRLTSHLTWHSHSIEPVRQLSFRLPRHWKVENLGEDVKTIPPDRLARSHLDERGAESVVTLELTAPLRTGESLRAFVRLQNRELGDDRPADEQSVPEIVALEGRQIDSSLAITLQSGLEVDVSGVPWTASSPPPSEGQPWAGQPADYYYAGVGRLKGLVRIRHHAAELSAAATTELIVRPGRPALLRYVVRLQPVRGWTRQIDVRFSRPSPPLVWTVAAGRNEDASKTAAKQGAASDHDGLIQRLELTRPFTEPVMLRAETELAGHDVPLVSIAGSARAEGRLIIRAPRGTRVEHRMANLEAVEPPSGMGSEPAPVWRVFRYGEGPATYSLLSASGDPVTNGSPIVDSVRLVGSVDAQGHVLCQYAFRLRGPAGSNATLLLPDEADVPSVKKNGVRLALSAHATNSLAFSCGDAADYEVSYLLPATSGRFLWRLYAPLPQWNAEAIVLDARQFWRLPRTQIPAWPLDLEETAEADAEARSEALQDKQIQPGADLRNTAAASWEVAWESIGEPVLCVPAALLHAAGVSVALGMMLLARQWTSARTRSAFAAGWLLASFLGLVWLPPQLGPLAGWPALAVVTWVLTDFFRRSVSRHPLTGVPGLLAAVPFLAVLLLFPRDSWGGDPLPTLVYVIRGAADSPDRDQILAPRSLWNELERWQGDAPPDRPDHLFVQAEYTGEIQSSAAVLEATYGLHLFRDGPVAVPLAVGNGRLANVLLDGAPALASPMPNGGYRVNVQGKGGHALRLRLELPLAPGVSEFRCPIPVAGVARLTLKLPRSFTHVEAIGVQGGQEVHHKDGPLLQADLGRVAELRIRWHSGSAKPAVLAVREIHYAELRSGENTLRSIFSFIVNQGEVDRVVIAVPEWLLVRTVQAYAEADAAVVLENWRMAGSNPERRIELRLRRPVRERFRVHLELLHIENAGSSWIAPRAAGVCWTLAGPAGAALLSDPRLEWLALGSRTVELPFPEPVLGDAGERLGGILAYRAEGARAELLSTRGLTPVLKPGATIFPQADLGPFVAASVLTFPPGPAPPLRVRLVSPQSEVRAVQDLTLGVGSNDVDVLARIGLERGPEAPPFLDCLVPSALRISNVEGDVRSWAQEGDRLQIWLKSNVKTAAKVTVAGKLPVIRDAKQQGTVRLPALQVLGVRPGLVRLDVRRREALAVRIGPTRGLTTPAGPPESARVVGAFVSRDGRYSGTLYVGKPEPSIQADWSVRLAPASERVAFQAEATCRFVGAPENSITFVLKNWRGEDLRVEGDEVREFRLRPAGDDLVGVVLLSAPKEFVRFRVHGNLPIAADGTVLIAAPAVQGAVRNEVWLLPLPGGLTPTAAAPLQPTSERVPWPRSGEALKLHALSADPRPTEVKLADYHTRPAYGGGLLHLARYQLLHEPGADWKLDMPERAQVLGVQLNGSPAGYRLEPPALSIPLAARSGWSEVSLLWLEKASDAVRLPTPVPPCRFPAVWTFHAPASADEAEPQDAGAALSAARQALIRADAYLRIEQALHAWAARAEGRDEQLARLEQRVRALLDQAEEASLLTAERDRETIAARAATLRAAHVQLLRQTGVGPPSLERAAQTDNSLFGDSGVLLRKTFEENPHAVRLEPLAEGRWFARRLWWSLLLAAAVAAGGVLATFGPVRNLLDRLWPEVLLGLGLAGWWLSPWPMVGGIVALIGLVCRLLLVRQNARYLEDLPAGASRSSSRISM